MTKAVISFKIEPYLKEFIDQIIRELGYQSRSQFLREAIVWYAHFKRAQQQGYECLCPCTFPYAKQIDEFYTPLDEEEEVAIV